MHRAFLLLILPMVVACQATSNRPDFLVRSHQDCMNGDKAACTMLAVLSDSPVQDQLRRPLRRDQRHERLSAVAVRAASANPDQPDQRQVQRDVEVIIEGINRARLSEPSRGSHIAPIGASGTPESP